MAISFLAQLVSNMSLFQMRSVQSCPNLKVFETGTVERIASECLLLVAQGPPGIVRLSVDHEQNRVVSIAELFQVATQVLLFPLERVQKAYGKYSEGEVGGYYTRLAGMVALLGLRLMNVASV